MLFQQKFGYIRRYLMLMGRTFSHARKDADVFQKYIKEMSQLGVDSIGIVTPDIASSSAQ